MANPPASPAPSIREELKRIIGEMRSPIDIPTDQQLDNWSDELEALYVRLGDSGDATSQWARGIDILMSVNSALHTVNSRWRIALKDGQAIAVPTPEVHSTLMGEDAPPADRSYKAPAWLWNAEAALEEVWREHRDPNDAHYNECDKDGQCAWCDDAEAALKGIRAAMVGRASLAMGREKP